MKTTWNSVFKKKCGLGKWLSEEVSCAHMRTSVQIPKTHIKTRQDMCTHKPSTKEINRWIPGACWPTSLVEMERFWFRDPIWREQGGQQQKDIRHPSLSSAWQRPIHMNISHTHNTHKWKKLQKKLSFWGTAITNFINNFCYDSNCRFQKHRRHEQNDKK